MITTETNSKDIAFLDYSVAQICEIFSRELNWELSKPEARPFTPLHLDICEDNSKAMIQQGATNVVFSDQTMNGWIALIKEEFYSIPEVEAIYLSVEQNNIDLWLIIPKRDFALLRHLINQEVKILENFATIEEPLFLFEFHIVYRCGGDESQFVPRRAIRLPR